MEQMTFVVSAEAEWRPKVRDLPSDLRPVNRLREVGPGALSTAELVACLLQTPDAPASSDRAAIAGSKG